MKKQKFTYEKSGVNINAADNFVNFISNIHQKIKAKKSLIILVVLVQFLIFQKNLKDPKIVACTDGVGTKLK